MAPDDDRPVCGQVESRRERIVLVPAVPLEFPELNVVPDVRSTFYDRGPNHWARETGGKSSRGVSPDAIRSRLARGSAGPRSGWGRILSHGPGIASPFHPAPGRRPLGRQGRQPQPWLGPGEPAGGTGAVVTLDIGRASWEVCESPSRSYWRGPRTHRLAVPGRPFPRRNPPPGHPSAPGSPLSPWGPLIRTTRRPNLLCRSSRTGVGHVPWWAAEASPGSGTPAGSAPIPGGAEA